MIEKGVCEYRSLIERIARRAKEVEEQAAACEIADDSECEDEPPGLGGSSYEEDTPSKPDRLLSAKHRMRRERRLEKERNAELRRTGLSRSGTELPPAAEDDSHGEQDNIKTQLDPPQSKPQEVASRSIDKIISAKD